MSFFRSKGLILFLFLFVGNTVVYGYDKSHLAKLKSDGSCIKCDLTGADLRKAKLANANLSGANLRGSILILADLR